MGWDGVAFAFFTAAVLVAYSCLVVCCPNCMFSIFLLCLQLMRFYGGVLVICLYFVTVQLMQLNCILFLLILLPR